MSDYDISGLHGLLDRGAAKFASAARPSALSKLGISPDQVRAALQRTVPLTPEEVRRAAARAVRKCSCGRGGLPGYVIAAMYADYQRGLSLAQVGHAYSRTRQAIYELFKTHALPCRPRRFKGKIVYAGRTYTPGKDEYYRLTSGDRHHLHRRMWEDVFGKIPDDHQVYFKNGDNADCRLANLDCAPIDEVTRYHQLRMKAERTNEAA
jgi:hypothetical protein